MGDRTLHLPLDLPGALDVAGEVALLFCGLDALKELNDAHGHEAGDAALVRVAAALGEAAAGYPGASICRIDRCARRRAGGVAPAMGEAVRAGRA